MSIYNKIHRIPIPVITNTQLAGIGYPSRISTELKMPIAYKK
jgi:hypothetical protein